MIEKAEFKLTSSELEKEVEGFSDNINEKDWLVINVVPQTSPRPRLTKRGIAYMPSWYKEYKLMIKTELLKLQVLKADWSELDVIAYFPYPASTPKKKLIEGAKHRKKPDWDNTAKTIADCLQEVGVIEDDKQLSDGSCKKRYTIGKLSLIHI